MRLCAFRETTMLLRAFAAALGCAFAARAGPAPEGHFSFRSYGGEQGLDNQVAWRAVQDAQGFLWVGTEDGAYRYDGQRFRHFGVADGLPSNWVIRIEVAAGQLWVGTFRGLARWNGARFQAAPDIPASQVNSLAVAPGGQLWVATATGLYRQSGGRFEAAPGWEGGEAHAVWADPGGAVFATRQGVLHRLGGRSWGAAEGLGVERIDAIRRDALGRLWLRSAGHLWLEEGDRFVDKSALMPGKSDQGYLALDRKGTLWVPTDHGLLHIDGDRTEVLGAAQGLPAPWVLDFSEDREGSRWIAGLGVHRLLGRGLWTAYGTREGLPGDLVWTVSRDPQGALWVGTDSGLAHDSGGRFLTVSGTEGHIVRTLARDIHGVVWLGGGRGELLRYDGGRVEVLPAPEGVPILSLCADPEGFVWAASDGAGLLRIDAKGKPTREALPQDDPREHFSQVVVDRAGRVWAAGEHGLAIREDGRWQRIGLQDGLRASHVTYLLERKDDGICVAYFESAGVTCLRWAHGARIVRHLDAAQGLSSNKVYQLGEDAAGRLWVGGGNGVDMVDGDRIEHFGRGDGLPSDDTDAAAFLADPDGDVWVGTSAGLGRFRGAGYQAPDPPATVIVSAQLGGRLLSANEPPPRVAHPDNTLDVRFAAMSFIDEARVAFELRLDGLEEAWHASDVAEARYSSLPPGAYRLEVRAHLGRGAAGPPAVLAFTVLPAWWQTWWFRLVSVLAMVGLVAGAWRVRVRALERSNRALEELVSARTAELARANESLLDLTVTDPLTGLKNRRYLREELPREAARTARLHRAALTRGLPRHNADLLVMMIDLDLFKQVNDTHGHAAGDLMLQQAARLFQKSVRETDAAVRYGGEEFLLLSRDADRRDAPALAERVRTLFRDNPFDLGNGNIVHKTCSIGVAAMPFIPAFPETGEWDEIVKLADHALMMAKSAGRDRWILLEATEPGSADALAGSPDALIAAGKIRVRSSDELLDAQEAAKA